MPAVLCILADLRTAGFVFERFGLPVGALADFVLDVAVSRENSAAPDATVRLMGNMGIKCLFASTCTNMMLVAWHIHRNSHLYYYVWSKQQSRGLRFALAVWVVIACSNVETMAMFLAMWETVVSYKQLGLTLGWDVIPLETRNDMGSARHNVSQLALWSQLVENVPELMIQLLAVIFRIKRRASVSWVSITSIVFTFSMLCGKMLFNVFANFMRQAASDELLESTIVDLGEREAWRKESALCRLLAPMHSFDWGILAVSLPCTLATMCFFQKAAFDAGIGSHSALLIVLYTGILSGISTMVHFVLVASFFARKEHRDRAWHLPLQRTSTVLVLLLSTVSPGMIGALHVEFRRAIYGHAAGWVPLVRSAAFVLVFAVAGAPGSGAEGGAATAGIEGFNRFVSGTAFSVFSVPPHFVGSFRQALRLPNYALPLAAGNVLAFAMLAYGVWSSNCREPLHHRLQEMPAAEPLQAGEAEEVRQEAFGAELAVHAMKQKLERVMAKSEGADGDLLLGDADGFEDAVVEDAAARARQSLHSGDKDLKTFMDWREHRRKSKKRHATEPPKSP